MIFHGLRSGNLEVVRKEVHVARGTLISTVCSELVIFNEWYVVAAQLFNGEMVAVCREFETTTRKLASREANPGKLQLKVIFCRMIPKMFSNTRRTA